MKSRICIPFLRAALYSIVAAAQANGLDTEQYLTDLFSQPAETLLLPFDL